MDFSYLGKVLIAWAILLLALGWIAGWAIGKLFS